MKKTTTSLLTSALILFCAGLLLALCATLYAKIAKVNVYDVEKKERTIEDKIVKLDQILPLSPEANYSKGLSEVAFTSIEIHSFAGDVVVCTGRETELSLKKTNTNNLSYRIVGDTLTIEEVDPVGFMGFYIDKGGVSFAGLRHLFHPGNAINMQKTITLTVPEDLLLKNVEIHSTSGNVSVKDVSAEILSIRSDHGKLTLKDLKNDQGKINVQGNKTDVELDRCHYVNCSVSSHFGSINATLLESTVQSTILDLWVGDIDVKTDLPTTHYKLSLSTTLGEIEKNDQSFQKKLTQDGTSAVRISSGILWGDFSLSFNGEDEKDYKPSTPVDQTETTTAQE